MFKPFHTTLFAGRSRITTGKGILALSALLAGIAAATAAQAQQPPMTTVTLLSQDKAAVDAKRMPTNDVVAHLSARNAGRSGVKMISLESCPKVPPDAVQGMKQTLQKNKFMVVLDLKEPDPRLCPR